MFYTHDLLFKKNICKGSITVYVKKEICTWSPYVD